MTRDYMFEWERDRDRYGAAEPPRLKSVS